MGRGRATAPVRANPLLAPPSALTLSDSIAAETELVRRDNELREQFWGRPPMETAHTAGLFARRWTTHDLDRVHRETLLAKREPRPAAVPPPAPTVDATMARRVALRNPQHSLREPQPLSQLLGEAAERAKSERRASASGRLFGMVASESSASTPLVPAGSARAALSMRSTRVRTRTSSGTRALLGRGQLSAVSIPSKLYMGSAGSNRVDYLAAERGGTVSPPKTRDGVILADGSRTSVSASFDMLPPHRYWQQERQEHWHAVNVWTSASAQEAAAYPQPPRPVTPKPEWLRLSDSRAAPELIATAEEVGAYMPALRRLELRHSERLPPELQGAGVDGRGVRPATTRTGFRYDAGAPAARARSSHADEPPTAADDAAGEPSAPPSAPRAAPAAAGPRLPPAQAGAAGERSPPSPPRARQVTVPSRHEAERIAETMGHALSVCSSHAHADGARLPPRTASSTAARRAGEGGGGGTDRSRSRATTAIGAARGGPGGRASAVGISRQLLSAGQQHSERPHSQLSSATTAVALPPTWHPSAVPRGVSSIPVHTRPPPGAFFMCDSTAPTASRSVGAATNPSASALDACASLAAATDATRSSLATDPGAGGARVGSASQASTAGGAARASYVPRREPSSGAQGNTGSFKQHPVTWAPPSSAQQASAYEHHEHPEPVKQLQPRQRPPASHRASSGGSVRSRSSVASNVPTPWTSAEPGYES